MLPNEIAILLAIEEAEKLSIQQLARVTDITGVALRYSCNSLIKRGYLEQNNSRGYRITFKGKEVILEALREMKDEILI